MYWLVANCCLVGFIEAIGLNLETWTHAEALQGKILWLNATLLSDQIGPLSYHIILSLVGPFFSEVRAWAIVTVIIPFLPGIERYSRDLKGQHRLLWFFFSLFFPLTVVGFRVKIL